MIAAEKTQRAHRELFPDQLNGIRESCDGFLVEAIFFTSPKISLSREALTTYLISINALFEIQIKSSGFGIIERITLINPVFMMTCVLDIPVIIPNEIC